MMLSNHLCYSFTCSFSPSIHPSYFDTNCAFTFSKWFLCPPRFTCFSGAISSSLLWMKEAQFTAGSAVWLPSVLCVSVIKEEFRSWWVAGKGDISMFLCTILPVTRHRPSGRLKRQQDSGHPCRVGENTPKNLHA